MKLVAIDFETADYGRDSACALGIVSIEDGRITRKGYRLIRPPRRQFVFTHIHGISWNDVRREATFAEVWDHFHEYWENADYFVAHNASFDRGVLIACNHAAGRETPKHSFICTVRVARSHWNIRPTTLSNVCTELDIRLQHHHAGSDALACANIALRAIKDGFPVGKAVLEQ